MQPCSPADIEPRRQVDATSDVKAGAAPNVSTLVRFLHESHPCYETGFRVSQPDRYRRTLDGAEVGPAEGVDGKSGAVCARAFQSANGANFYYLLRGEGYPWQGGVLLPRHAR